MLTAANETTLKQMIKMSTLNAQTKKVLLDLITALAVMSPATVAQAAGLASDSLIGTTETITIVNGLITAIAANL